MKSKNKTTTLLALLGIVLILFGIANLDESDLSVTDNLVSYSLFFIAILSFFFAFYKSAKEKKGKKNLY